MCIAVFITFGFNAAVHAHTPDLTRPVPTPSLQGIWMDNVDIYLMMECANGYKQAVEILDSCPDSVKVCK